MKAKVFSAAILTAGIASAITYPIVDTAQQEAYGPYKGQDAHYSASAPSYRDNGDGTVSDLVTGLMWTQDPGAKKHLQMP